MSPGLTQARTRAAVTVLAEWAVNTGRGGGEINIPLNIPLAGLSGLKHRVVCPLYTVIWWQAGRQAAATRGGKSKKGGDSWSTSCTIILKHHRERTREAASASAAAGERGEWIYGPLDFFFFGSESTGKSLCG